MSCLRCNLMTMYKKLRYFMLSYYSNKTFISVNPSSVYEKGDNVIN